MRRSLNVFDSFTKQCSTFHMKKGASVIRAWDAEWWNVLSFVAGLALSGSFFRIAQNYRAKSSGVIKVSFFLNVLWLKPLMRSSIKHNNHHLIQIISDLISPIYPTSDTISQCHAYLRKALVGRKQNKTKQTKTNKELSHLQLKEHHVIRYSSFTLKASSYHAACEWQCRTLS